MRCSILMCTITWVHMPSRSSAFYISMSGAAISVSEPNMPEGSSDMSLVQAWPTLGSAHCEIKLFCCLSQVPGPKATFISLRS